MYTNFNHFDVHLCSVSAYFDSCRDSVESNDDWWPWKSKAVCNIPILYKWPFDWYDFLLGSSPQCNDCISSYIPCHCAPHSLFQVGTRQLDIFAYRARLYVECGHLSTDSRTSDMTLVLPHDLNITARHLPQHRWTVRISNVGVDVVAGNYSPC